MTTPRRCLATALGCVVLLTACSSPTPQTKPDNQAADRKSGSKSGPSQSGKGKEAQAAQAGAKKNRQGSDDGAAEAEESVGGEDASAAERGVSLVRDPAKDTEDSGESPGYVDLRAASITDLGRQVRFRIDVDGPFEQRLDGSMYVYLGFELGEKNDRTSIAAEGDSNGWVPTVNGEPLRGSFEIEDTTMTFVVSWAQIGGRRAFDWYVNSSWSYSDALRTDYSFDRAPEFTARYR